MTSPRTAMSNAIEAQRSEIERLTADLASATERNAALAAQNETLTKERETAVLDLASANSCAKEARRQVAALTKERDDARAEIATLKAAEVSTEEKARLLLASQGHRPLAISSEDPDGKGPKTPTDPQARAAALRKEYDAMTDSTQRAAFYSKHREEMSV